MEEIIEFFDKNNQKCSLQKSSLAADNCIWLGVDTEKRMHLSMGMIINILPYLKMFSETGEINDPRKNHEIRSR